MRTQLLCTFSNKNDYESELIRVASNYNIIFNKIFILEDIDNPFRLYITYNINPADNHTFLPHTLSVHRKKDTNTIYTINALNELVKEVNNGVLDKSYEIEWDDYYNTIILTDSDGLKIRETSLFKIINL